MENRYPQNCAQCGNLVPAGEGDCVKSCGRWLVSHKFGKCLPPATVVATVEVEPGAYVMADGRLLRVERGRQNRRLQGFMWSPTEHVAFGGEKIQRGGWTYTGSRLFDQITRPLTADEAHTFGRITRTCCYCGLGLTTPESVGAGYGPTCAKNHRLPWGKATAQLANIGADAAATLFGLVPSA